MLAVRPLPRCRGSPHVHTRSLAAAGVTSTLQAKVLHYLVEGDGGFPGTAVCFQCSSAQVRILQVIEAVFDQFAEVESLAATGDASEVLEPGLNVWVQAD